MLPLPVQTACIQGKWFQLGRYCLAGFSYKNDQCSGQLLGFTDILMRTGGVFCACTVKRQRFLLLAWLKPEITPLKQLFKYLKNAIRTQCLKYMATR